MLKEMIYANESIIGRSSTWYEKMKPVFEDLRNTPYAVIKGEALSLQAYGILGVRNSNDIDILINKKDLKKIDLIMRRHFFLPTVYDECGHERKLTRVEEIMMKNSHQVVPYIQNDLEIDINVDIFWGEYRGRRVEIDTFLKNTHFENIYGAQVSVLDDIPAFISLCLHHYREMNAIYLMKYKNPFRKEMFRDVFYFYKNRIFSQQEDFITKVKSYEICPFIYYVLYWTNYIYRDEELVSLLSQIETDDGISCLHKYGLSPQEQKKWKVSFDTRLDSDDLFSIICHDLTDHDLKKINMNWSIF